MYTPVTLKFPYTIENLLNSLEVKSTSMLIINEKDEVTFSNSVFLSASGYVDIDELNNIKIRNIVHFQEPLKNLAQTLQNNNILSIHTKNKTIIESTYSVISLQTHDDQHQGFLIMLYDLHNSNLIQHFSATFMKDVNLGVLLINKEFQLIDISDMACTIFGMKKEEVIDKSLDEIFKPVPREYQLVQRTVLEGLVTKNHAVSWINDSQRFELLMDSNTLKNSNGDTVGAYIILKDVSNLRSLEEQVQRSDRLAMIGQIAAGTAHEIRNPLTSIKGFLQVIKKSLKENQMNQEFEFTNIMLTEIDRINGLVSEFLLLSKPRDFVFEQVDLSKVMQEIKPIIHNEAILHDVEVQYHSASNLPFILANTELIKQVCLNICKNGIEAMVDGGTLSITEKIDERNKQVSIEIHDTGPGIPSFLVDKIFDPFFTTKQEGTGLGLSVCQRIIHDIGGSIRVSSKGFGTTFIISMPLPGG
ncbi:ATP-binding protein [Chengkuizengella sp. SCS-71B]|uniref:ATP-binding protein n=1 Tax=Chengkuizengella sp. SCS-71B TaxID=3115290 RepID=UPI0039B7496D